MDAQNVMQVLLALPLPVAWALAVTLAAWWTRRGNEPPRPMESRLIGSGPLRAGALALGGAMILGAISYINSSNLWTKPSFETWPAWAAAGAMAMALLERYWEGVRGLVWIFRAMLIIAVVASLAGRLAAWGAIERTAWIAGFGSLSLGAWWCFERTASRPGPAGPLVFWLVATFTSMTLVTTGSVKGAAAASWLAAGCGAVLLASIIRPQSGVTLKGPGTTVFAMTIATLWFLGPNSGSTPLWMILALAACAPAACLADMGPLAKLPPWKHAMVRMGLAAIPGLAVLAVAVPKAAKDAAESHEETQAPGNPQDALDV
jgi:hypothetical protein